MITADDFSLVRAALGEVAEEDIAWAQDLREPVDPDDFAREVIFVICNSGMKNTVARGIYDRVVHALDHERAVFSVFKHPGKAQAIETIWRDRVELHAAYLDADDQLEFARSLPWIGAVTAYHVVKNFGADVAKPDVHLQRLADREGCTAQELCQRLAKETGLRVAAIDTVLWRACANGIIDSKTGAIRI